MDDQAPKKALSAKCRRLILLTGIALFLAPFVLIQTFSPEPGVYRGKSAGEWLDEVNPAMPGEPLFAVQKLGPAALYEIKKRLHARDSAFVKALYDQLNKLPFIENKFVHIPANVRRDQALSAVLALGSDAAPVLPDLIPLYRGPDPQVYRKAAGAIGNIGGPQALEVLRQGLDEDDVARCAAALGGLSLMGVQAKPALSRMIELTEHENRQIRQQACWALGRLNYSPEQIVPALMRRLTDSDESIRSGIPSLLRGFGADAVSSTKELVRLTQDDSMRMQRSAMGALRSINFDAFAAMQSRHAASQDLLGDYWFGRNADDTETLIPAKIQMDSKGAPILNLSPPGRKVEELRLMIYSDRIETERVTHESVTVLPVKVTRFPVPVQFIGKKSGNKIHWTPLRAIGLDPTEESSWFLIKRVQ